jgi:hypothetical protein
MLLKPSKKKYKHRKKGPILHKNEAKAMIDRAVNKRPERKYFDTTSSIITVQPFATTIPIQLNSITLGNTVNTRVGNKVTPVNLAIRCLYGVNFSAAGDPPVNARVIVFQWHPDTQSADPDMADIIGNTNAINGFFNTNTAGQFSVLFDERFCLENPTYQSSGGNSVRLFDISIPRDKLRQMEFNGSGTSGRETLWLMFLHDSQNLSGYYPQVRRLETRLRYVDL